MLRFRPLLLALLLAAPLACKPAFDPKIYPSTDKLYQAATAEYKARHYDNAAKAFEKLTLDLPARDPRLPLAFYYLAQSQNKQGENLLAAGTYNRLIDAFPQDSLVDDALYLSGRAYQAEWRHPELDATYGSNALTAYQSLLASYPDSPFADPAKKEIGKLDEWLAEKDYNTGYLYLKRKAFDSAILYFKDVIRLHPNAPKAKDAYLRLLEAYRAIRYTEDARDLCDAMRKAYPNDRDVSRACGPAPATRRRRPMRIGVFGGTFDPPHVGHLLLAADAREALKLDRLIFIPVWAQPFKVGTPPVASPQDRLEMVRLAVADDANYVVDEAEINRKGLSYTVDTLEHLAERYKGAQLFLLMGQDALAGFPNWRNPERIRELATLAAMGRSGEPGVPATFAVEGVVTVSTRQVDVSSTEIRERRRAKKSIKGFVPESVERFIEARGLYR